MRSSEEISYSTANPLAQLRRNAGMPRRGAYTVHMRDLASPLGQPLSPVESFWESEGSYTWTKVVQGHSSWSMTIHDHPPVLMMHSARVRHVGRVRVHGPRTGVATTACGQFTDRRQRR